MLVEVRIGDNDLNFIMTWAVKYVCFCLPSYLKDGGKKSVTKIVRETIEEFLDSMHVEKKTKEYILSRLKVKNRKKMDDWNNFESFYIYDRFEDGDYFDYMLK